MEFTRTSSRVVKDAGFVESPSNETRTGSDVERVRASGFVPSRLAAPGSLTIGSVSGAPQSLLVGSTASARRLTMTPATSGGSGSSSSAAGRVSHAAVGPAPAATSSGLSGEVSSGSAAAPRRGGMSSFTFRASPQTSGEPARRLKPAVVTRSAAQRPSLFGTNARRDSSSIGSGSSTGDPCSSVIPTCLRVASRQGSEDGYHRLRQGPDAHDSASHEPRVAYRPGLMLRTAGGTTEPHHHMPQACVWPPPSVSAQTPSSPPVRRPALSPAPASSCASSSTAFRVTPRTANSCSPSSSSTSPDTLSRSAASSSGAGGSMDALWSGPSVPTHMVPGRGLQLRRSEVERPPTSMGGASSNSDSSLVGGLHRTHAQQARQGGQQARFLEEMAHRDAERSALLETLMLGRDDYLQQAEEMQLQLAMTLSLQDHGGLPGPAAPAPASAARPRTVMRGGGGFGGETAELRALVDRSGGGGALAQMLMAVSGQQGGLPSLIMGSLMERSGGDGGSMELSALMGGHGLVSYARQGSEAPELSYEALCQLEDVKVTTSADVLARLQRSTYTPIGGCAEGSSCACPVCQCEYAAGDSRLHLPCQHIFHEECVAEWLTKYSHCCPICKADVLPATQ